jgi:hypothetical protein
MRYACNQRLRQAFHWWGNSVCHHEPRDQALYMAHRDRGHTHARAVRAVMDRRLNILVACLEHGRLYRRTTPLKRPLTRLRESFGTRPIGVPQDDSGYRPQVGLNVGSRL